MDTCARTRSARGDAGWPRRRAPSGGVGPGTGPGGTARLTVLAVATAFGLFPCLAGPATAQEREADTRDRGEPRTSLVVDPQNGRVPPLSEEGRERLAGRRRFIRQFGSFDNPENRPLAERCIMSFGPNAGPPMLPNYFYNNNYTIVQTPDRIMIMTEMVHDVRIIRLGEPKRMPKHIRPWMGDSWGRWEGDTLVVETTNLHPDQTLQGIPPSEEMPVIERFTRVSESTINYEFTVEDPLMRTRPWSGEVPFNRLDGLVYEYACHEGNYALENVLSGARAEERRK